jgi:hypothetical protein
MQMMLRTTEVLRVATNTSGRSPIQDVKMQSAVSVEAMNEDHVVLDLPESVHDAKRLIPLDMVDIGQRALNWFAWDMEEKVPRAPHKNNGWAGKSKWGSENISMEKRYGSRFEDVLDALDGCADGYQDDTWFWPDKEEPHDLYPMAIKTHADCQDEDAPLMLVDLDDVIEPQGDGTGLMTREAWDIITDLDAYAEVSNSMKGVHVFVKAALPGFVPGKKVMQDLESGGHVELYGYPADGRIIGTTWMHIEGTPRHAIPDRQDVIDEVAEELLDDEDQLSDEEQAEEVLKNSDVNVSPGSDSNRSQYYDIDTVGLVTGTKYTVHGGSPGSGGPHPIHGGTSTPDEDSTNFVAFRNGVWYCHAHETSGGPLHLIALLERIVDCENVGDMTDDPVTCLRTCLAARDKYTNGELDDENPPTTALKGALEIQGIDYSSDGKFSRGKWKIARSLYDSMEYTG